MGLTNGRAFSVKWSIGHFRVCRVPSAGKRPFQKSVKSPWMALRYIPNLNYRVSEVLESHFFMPQHFLRRWRSQWHYLVKKWLSSASDKNVTYDPRVLGTFKTFPWPVANHCTMPSFKPVPGLLQVTPGELAQTAAELALMGIKPGTLQSCHKCLQVQVESHFVLPLRYLRRWRSGIKKWLSSTSEKTVICGFWVPLYPSQLKSSSSPGSLLPSLRRQQQSWHQWGLKQGPYCLVKSA